MTTFKFNNELETLVKTHLKNNHVPMLLGEPGIGKSSWVENLGAKIGTKVFTLQCNELSEKADLTGVRTIPIDDAKTKWKQVFFPHADIMDAIEYANKNPDETPILFLDEINRTTPDITSALMSIRTRRKIGNVELPSNLKLIVAGNDKGNVTILDSASTSRFILYNVGPDADTYFNIEPNLHSTITTVLMNHPSLIFCKGITPTVKSDDDDDDSDNDNYLTAIYDDEGMDQFTTPRTISSLSDTLNDLSTTTLKKLNSQQVDYEYRGHTIPITLLMSEIIAQVGYTEFALRLYDELSKTLNQVTNTVINKPDDYDDIVQNHTSTISSIQTRLQTVSDEEKSHILLYALTDKTSDKNSLRALISEIASTLQMFTPDDLKVYAEKHNNGTLEPSLDHYLRTKQDLQDKSLVTVIKLTTTD